MSSRKNQTLLKILLVLLAFSAAVFFGYPLFTDEPAPAPAADEPVFSFAQFSDVHFDSGAGAADWTQGSGDRLTRAIAQVNDIIKPDFVVFTGDSVNSQHRPQALGSLKELLDSTCRVKYYMVKGNHDGPGFSKVFGKRCYTFEHKGLLFVAFGYHYIDPYHMQAATCDQLPWLKKVLAENKSRRVVILVHDPIVPNSFLDAPTVQLALKEAGNVVAVLSGHMHFDGWNEADGIVHIVAPCFGADPHVFKEYKVFADRIEVRNWLVKEGKYVQGEELRKITFPPVKEPVQEKPDSQPENIEKDKQEPKDKPDDKAGEKED
ncbi:MAG: metallophosphoesterase [Planctomycetota bacterium]|nr:metallophosphoesterase [Planctomycetota bacterium]